MVLHASAHAAPHAFVGHRVDAIALRTQGGEIDIATSLGVLGREDVVPHGLLVEIGILGIAGAVEQHLRELQHVVGVARLRTIGLVDIAIAVGSGEEVLVHRVATDADGAVGGHILPEVLGSGDIIGGSSVHLANTLHANELWHLGVGVLTIEERGVECLHAVEHRLVGVLLGCLQIFLVAKELVGIEQRLVHATVFAVEEAFEGLVINLGNKVGAPVGQLAEHLLGFLAAGIEIGIAKTGQNLVLAIEGHPAPVFADA